jgi:hypothetical protein
MATATKMAMATAIMRVMGDKEGKGNSGKSDSNSDKGGRQAAATREMATAMVTATRLVGDKEGKGRDNKINGDGNEGGG